LTFLALGAAAMALVLLATAGAIVFLYWLKPPPQRVIVPSTFIWSRVLKERKRSSDFWRWLVSLLAALAAALAIAAAIGRPEIEALSGKARRIVVVIDDSPSMGARTASGATRFELAVEKARGLLGEASAGSQYLVTDTAGRLAGAEFSDRRAALERLGGLRVSLAEATAFPAGDPLLVSDPATEIYFVTDGVMVRETPPGVRVVSVFEPVDNVGITAFDLRAVPAEPNRFEAFLELSNHSSEPKRVALQLDGASAVSVSSAVVLGPGQVRGETLDLDRFPSGPVRALIDSPGDGYELDNVAYAYLGAPKKVRVVLATAGNTYLETLLPLDPRIVLAVVPPDRIPGPEGDQVPDLYVFDGFAPEKAPRAPALLFRPNAAAWLPAPAGTEIRGLSLAGTERDHPLMANVSLDDVVVERAALVARGEGDRAVAGSDDEPLILAGESPVRFALVTFALSDSNLPFQSSFPVFLSNAVSWLAGTEVVASSLRTVAVPVAEAVVTDVEGHEVPARPRGARTSFAAEAPGLYYVKGVKGGESEVVVSANLLSPRASAVNASALAPGPGGAGEWPKKAGSGGGELWIRLLLFALVVLVVEWFTYHRRLTV
jgi:hypothetical protein